METVTKTTKKTTPTGDHPKLPLKGEKGGSQKSIDNKTEIHSIPDPDVRKKAKTHAHCLDEVYRTKTNANDTGQELLKALLKSKKSRKIIMPGACQTYVFTADARARLQTKKEKTVK